MNIFLLFVSLNVTEKCEKRKKNQKNQVREENDFSQHFPLTIFLLLLASNTRNFQRCKEENSVK